MGGWLVVVGGGLALGYFINKRQAANDAAATAPVSDPDSDVGVGGGQFQYDPIQTVPNPTEPVEEDNVAWGKKAVNYLVSLGYAGTFAQNVVAKFLSAEVLTASEKLLIDQAIVRFGSPPEPIAPTEGTPTIPTPTTPKPPIPAPGGVVARPLRRAVRYTWTWPKTAPPIAGFRLTVKNLSTGRTVVTKNLSVIARSYTYTVPASMTKRNSASFQVYIRAFQGGFAVPDSKKRFGPGAGASARPLL
jgi:hypothetical protein